MVNCRYTVTADIYEDLIELQIRLKNRTPSQQLKFWGLNVGFLIAAILFLLLERDYSIVLRILALRCRCSSSGSRGLSDVFHAVAGKTNRRRIPETAGRWLSGPAPSVYGGTESALPLWDPDEKRIRLCHTEYYPAEKLCCTGG